MKFWPILLAFLVSPGLGQKARPDAVRMDQVVLSFVNAKQFMGSVLVARGDELLFDKSYGMANLEWNIPNTPATKFRIGSLTKPFTAAAIRVPVLLASAQKRARLAHRCSDYFSGRRRVG